jgi:serine O-acetyltransferase
MFAAYGVTPNGDDPLSKALRNLINHVAQQDAQIERMCSTIKAAGIACPGMDESDKLDQAQLNRLVE